MNINIRPLIPAILLVLSMTACGVSATPDAGMSTSPGISVQITEGSCPSVEVQAGMQITWTNLDKVDRMLIIERTNEAGIVMDSGGTDLLQPGSAFSITLTEAGEYTYYCSLDRMEFGTIHVLSNSPVPVQPSR
jgi:plastocyanin